MFSNSAMSACARSAQALSPPCWKQHLILPPGIAEPPSLQESVERLFFTSLGNILPKCTSEGRNPRGSNLWARLFPGWKEGCPGRSLVGSRAWGLNLSVTLEFFWGNQRHRTSPGAHSRCWGAPGAAPVQENCSHGHCPAREQPGPSLQVINLSP